MTIVLIAGAIFCGWVLLSLLGGERQRRITDLEAEQASEAAGQLQEPTTARLQG
jgi:hypothetical protein